MIYSIEPSAIEAIKYQDGKTISMRLVCGFNIMFHTLAAHADKTSSEVMGGRDSLWKCPNPCGKPCPVTLEERDGNRDQAAH